MRRLRPVAGWACCAALGLAACSGARAVSVVDGGADADRGADSDASTTDAPHAAAYQVTATIDTLTPDPSQGGEWDQFPRTATFTLDWDGTSDTGYVGGGGVFSVTSLHARDGGSYEPGGDIWAIGVPFDADCRGRAILAFDRANELSIDEDGVLHGSATGHAYVRTSAAGLSADAHVTFTGVPDTTAPTFTFPKSPVDPLAPLAFVPSEALPGADSASVVGAMSGDVVPLAKGLIATASDALADVHVAGIALRYDETYRLVTDALPDFAGNVPAPVSFTTRATPPLVPEDGFESVTGTMFGGAGVLNGGPLPPLAGQTSLLLNTGYGGGFGFLPYDLGPSLVVRLTVAPGDTVVRFDSELIAPDPIDAASFDGELRIGAVGGPVSVSHGVAGTEFTKVTLPQLGDVYVSPVKTIELPLPAGAQGEITFEIVGTIDLCEQPPPPTVLVIDNLRVE
jgi:hypothetical protein